MADLKFDCTADCNLLGKALAVGATPREALLAFGKLMRLHYQEGPLAADVVEMYANLVASYLPGPGAGSKNGKLSPRVAERLMAK